MLKNILFYIIGGALAITLIVYAFYLTGFIVEQVSVVSEADLLEQRQAPAFDLEKFNELRID